MIQENEAEQSGPANHRPFGTSGMSPADSASRAGVMPKASDDPSSGTFARNMNSFLQALFAISTCSVFTGYAQNPIYAQQINFSDRIVFTGPSMQVTDQGRSSTSYTVFTNRIDSISQLYYRRMPFDYLRGLNAGFMGESNATANDTDLHLDNPVSLRL